MDMTKSEKNPYDIPDIPESDYFYKDDDGTWMVQPHKEGWIIEPRAIYGQEELKKRASVRRMDDGRIIKLEDAKFSELVNGEWVTPSDEIWLGEFWRAYSIDKNELGALMNRNGDDLVYSE